MPNIVKLLFLLADGLILRWRIVRGVNFFPKCFRAFLVYNDSSSGIGALHGLDKLMRGLEVLLLRIHAKHALLLDAFNAVLNKRPINGLLLLRHAALLDFRHLLFRFLRPRAHALKRSGNTVVFGLDARKLFPVFVRRHDQLVDAPYQQVYAIGRQRHARYPRK